MRPTSAPSAKRIRVGTVSMSLCHEKARSASCCRSDTVSGNAGSSWVNTVSTPRASMSPSTGAISSHVGQSRFTTATKPSRRAPAASPFGVVLPAFELMAGGYIWPHRTYRVLRAISGRGNGPGGVSKVAAVTDASDQPSIDSGLFRNVLGHFPTGVTAVTAVNEGRPVGMAIGSFMSVSLDPPLVAFLPTKDSTSWADIRAAGSFCVNVMAQDQMATCGVMASRADDKFVDVSWHPGPDWRPHPRRFDRLYRLHHRGRVRRRRSRHRRRSSRGARCARRQGPSAVLEGWLRHLLPEGVIG